eukprot:CAMPEP_0197625788 /NCGR_PEP_ID=MMETSP1338-20131121/5045_1 /TAXON_ID=43686 ORGANISM="Pelagodinium beii, Strain RCC1491" /NCGR_SAMPLE_ID=MMETSP1338 /ASSEMBLY_ACC=CAM_ASM_000754 /LENGTH=491 /DNA_ID=CAMNT_0043196275 /DNA_START=8 /DNA_END=1483 /DNA_ORIENTATION=-
MAVVLGKEDTSEISDFEKDTSKQSSWKKWIAEMIVLNAVMVMWNTDNMLLPAIYTEIARHYGVSQGALSMLGLVRGIFESIFALPAGFLADRMSRPVLICAGSLIWAGGLIGCAFSPTLGWMAFWRAVNGIGLGLVQPLLLSLIADKSSVARRGKAFGVLQFTGMMGQTIFTAAATSIAGYQIAGMAGWQFALVVVALISAIVGLLAWVLVSELQHKAAASRGMLIIMREEMPTVLRIFCTPTFLVIIGQGIFGTAPWFAFSYLTAWLELNCFSNSQAALIYAFFNVGCAISSFAGGGLLDALFARFPDHGPPAMSQLSVFLSVPLLALILFGLGGIDSHGESMIVAYCVVFLITGVLIAWNGVTNNKMFSDIVPQKSFQYIYALDRCIEGVFGALGTPAVGWLTDSVFGFDTQTANSGDCSPSNAESLAKGVFTVSAVGFGICFCFYAASHWTYPRDRIAVAESARLEEEAEEQRTLEASAVRASQEASV